MKANGLVAEPRGGNIRPNEEIYFTMRDISNIEREKFENRVTYIESQTEDIDRFSYEDIAILTSSTSNPYAGREDELYAAIKQLTKKQQNVVNCFIRGMTQKEIAAELGICQTNVHKTLNGNWVPKYKTYHGGIFNKLQKIMTKDEKDASIKEVLKIKHPKQSKPKEKLAMTDIKMKTDPSDDIFERISLLIVKRAEIDAEIETLKLELSNSLAVELISSNK